MPNSSPRTSPKKTLLASSAQVRRGSVADKVIVAAFPIVGLGASAGGLEALEHFFSHVPKDSGLAFVVVQHLDPTRKGILVELLQRSTVLPVDQIKDRMAIQPNHVYVIPPNKDLSILHGVLHLLQPTAPRGLRLPIDFFFRSLALDRQQLAMAVILSGMGSDGAAGVQAIREQGGGVFVQTPTSAKFDSMPRAAIEGGLVSVIALAEELPEKIAKYLLHLPAPVLVPDGAQDKDLGSWEKVILLLRNQTGHDFSQYKSSTISRRMERRLQLHKLKKISDYVRYLRENPQESELLFKELLIGVTSFFRDPSVWETLKQKTIPDYLKDRSPGETLRAWTVGCSTGEEAYSLAMVFREVLEESKSDQNFSLQIFATDLDKDAIDKARVGSYRSNLIADVSQERLRRFFIPNESGGYTVKKEIREMVIFAPQNLVMHPPFTRLDFVTCRNLLIYLDAELQKKILPLFHYSLNPGGILLLGIAETIGANTDLFTPLVSKLRIYRRLANTRNPNLMDFPSAFGRVRVEKGVMVSPATEAAAGPSLQVLADQLLLQRYSPAAVLVTKQGDILYVSGKTGKYLEPAAGKANWNLFAMAREGLGNALVDAFHQALPKKKVITLRGIEVGTRSETQVLDVTVQPLNTPSALADLVMVIFLDVEVKKAAKAANPDKRTTTPKSQLSSISEELRQAHEDLQASRHEMQASQEELKSTNEELQSMNEELQSTNEELTTSKEEMQSMNEELQTVNHELQAKVDELSRASNDMKNLLNSTDIATLFLDDNLIIRRFTTQAASIIKLIPGDVGRQITDIVSTLDYPDLVSDIRKVLHTLAFVEKQVSASDGRWFSVRTMPYRTQENQVDGVVITFSNITVAKSLEAQLRKVQSDQVPAVESKKFKR